MSGLGTIQNARIIPNGTQWNEGSFPVFWGYLLSVGMTLVIGWSSSPMERIGMRSRHPEWNVVK